MSMPERDWRNISLGDPPRPPGHLVRIEVCRGPAPGRWAFRARVPDMQMGEIVLTRWRKEHPGQVVWILYDGEPWEDEARKRARLEREKLAREAAYFDGLAAEAEARGDEAEADYCRSCADRFLSELDAIVVEP